MGASNIDRTESTPLIFVKSRSNSDIFLREYSENSSSLGSYVTIKKLESPNCSSVSRYVFSDSSL